MIDAAADCDDDEVQRSLKWQLNIILLKVHYHPPAHDVWQFRDNGSLHGLVECCRLDAVVHGDDGGQVVCHLLQCGLETIIALHIIDKAVNDVSARK